MVVDADVVRPEAFDLLFELKLVRRKTLRQAGQTLRSISAMEAAYGTTRLPGRTEPGPMGG